MQDHRKLRAFQAANTMVKEVYRVTVAMPDEERYGLTSQMRRAAVSVPSNIVEGCVRATNRDFAHFLHIAYGSAMEVQYQLSLAVDLGFLTQTGVQRVAVQIDDTCKMIFSLIQKVRASQDTPGSHA